VTTSVRREILSLILNLDCLSNLLLDLFDLWLDA
jgi:hypothetical protein